MPIVKDGGGNVVFTPPDRQDLFELTGVAHNGNFAVCDKKDLLKQIQLDPGPSATNSTVILQTGAGTTGTVILTLPTSSGAIGGGITALTGDVSASGTGSVTATVNSVGGFTPSVSPATANTVIVRDANGYLEDSQPSFSMNVVEDFVGYQPGNNNGLFNGSSSGTGSSYTPAGGGALIDSAHPGIAPMSTGTDTGGETQIFTGTGFVFGGGTTILEWVMYWPALSTGGDAYTTVMGFNNAFNYLTSISNNGLALIYTHSSNSGKFVMWASNNNTSTQSNSTVAPIPNAWNKYKIVVNAAASLATFYQNGVSMGTISTNIPITTNSLPINFTFVKSAGTNARAFNIDYVWLNQTFTTPR